ncbi:MAG TPA: hydantoinase B/oxoprolinase family protein [Terriglobales bacterium]|nr:hydantoinase B/oxoprolinase family protein [Terriglobales bacterium]
MRRDPVELEIFKNIFHSIAEEMGASLRRTAFSPNIKERRDYSCAVFDAAGEVIAMGDHMPVHLGSMPMSVRAAIARLRLEPGDVAMLNDPFCGGTHLPDITLVAPVFLNESVILSERAGLLRRAQASRTLARASKDLERGRRPPPHFYVASRAHHADVGGAYAGSMGLCRETYQEGVRIPPVKLMRAGRMEADVLALLLNNVRTPHEREGDLGAQIAACHTGSVRLAEVVGRYGLARVRRAARDLLDYSEEMMRAFLARVPRGTFRAEDFLDDDGVTGKPVRIAASITFHKGGSKGGSKIRPHTVTVDFQGTDPQVEGSINAVEAITYSACFYVFRCLLAEEVPATAGLMRPIRVIAPAGTVVNARPPAAVAGGNVETSQRIVDVLLQALAKALPARILAGSSGTMNNLTIGGMDPRTGEPFAYYETIAGGLGARPTKPGVSGIHTHMTNSLNTPAEALEYAYPFRVRRYSLRPRSGGAGKQRGGDGIVREVEVLTGAEVTILSDRRKRGPRGLAGGKNGAPGRTIVLRRDGREEILPSKASTRLKAGERVRVESPGGGGWGKP